RPSRHELVDPAEESFVAGDEPIRQEFRKHRFVEFRAKRARGEDRLDLRRENDFLIGNRVIQRLDAEPVAREQQPPLLLVPDRESEHSLKFLHAALAFFFIEMKNRLGIAARAVHVTGRFENWTKSGVVINFAVVGDPYRLVFVRHRLVAAGEVYDRESAMTEADRSVDP